MRHSTEAREISPEERSSGSAAAASWAPATTSFGPGDSIYFLVLDRFADGDPSNNDQGHGEYDPDDPLMFHGGDLRGVEERLGYIEGMGFSAIRSTPVVRNYEGCVLADGARRAPYHGYWGYDLRSVDPHFGDLAQLRATVAAIHRRGMKFVVDLVFNHLSPTNAVEDHAYPDFGAEDFHHFGRIENLASCTSEACSCAAGRNPWDCEWAVENGDLADLADLDTANPSVQLRLAEAHASYLNAARVDGVVLDTVKHVPRDDWIAMMAALRERLHCPARDFAMGEVLVWQGGQEGMARKAGFYTLPGSSDAAAMESVLNFGFYGAVTLRLFSKGGAVLSDLRRNQFDRGFFRDPYLLGNFIDSHDVPRFLGIHRRRRDRLHLALGLLFTWPGIPMVYYGTEQEHDDGGKGDPENRPPLWWLGYDASNPTYRYLRRLNGLLRGDHACGRALRHRSMRERLSRGPIFAFERGSGKDCTPEDRALVVLNSGSWSRRISKLSCSLVEGRYRGLLNPDLEIEVDAAGAVRPFRLARTSLEIFATPTGVEGSPQ